MKKLLLVFICFILVACTSPSTDEPTASPSATTEPEPTVLKMGSGSVTAVSTRSDATAEAVGESRILTTICVVVLEDDVIRQVTFDAVQATTEIDAEGIIQVEYEPLLSKKELGDDYNMKTYGGSIGEWYEEVAGLEAYLIGKTVSEALMTESDEDAMAELQTTTTITVTDFIAALDKAATAAVEADGLATIGLGTSSVYGEHHSYDATADTEGALELDVTYAAAGYDSEGQIVYVQFDVAQNSVTFDATGVYTTDTTAATPTKLEKGDDYNMKTYGGSIGEWYEEVGALEDTIMGMTVAEAIGIPADETAMTELQTTTTITIDDFMIALDNTLEEVKSVE